MRLRDRVAPCNVLQQTDVYASGAGETRNGRARERERESDGERGGSVGGGRWRQILL